MAVRERASTTRKALLVVLGIIFVVGPIVLLSSLGLGAIESWSDEKMKDPEAAPTAALWQWRVAVVYAYTFRPAAAAEAYESAYLKYRQVGDLESAGLARYQQGVELEEAEKKYEALAVYESILEEFAHQDACNDAKAARGRLKYLSRP